MSKITREELSQSLIKEFQDLNEKIDINTKRLKGMTTVDITEFGASRSNLDNHDAIVNALNYVNNNGGGVVTVPIGTFKTSPISFEGMKNITLQGQTSSMPWQINSELIFINGNGDVGLQLCEQAGIGFANEIPSWSAKSITIKNLFLDCNNNVDHGINGNYAVTLQNVTVRRAKSHGIVLEPETYPFFIERCESSFNKGDGIYIKSPFTTCWDIHNSEFSGNDGYGMYIEGGNTSTLLSVLCQSNKRGGFRLHKPAQSLYEKDVYMDKLLFISCYTEANGTLEKGDEKYDGNFAIKISSFDTTQNINLNKIEGLQFINCSFNKSSMAEKAIHVEGVSNIDSLNSDFTKNSFDFTKCGTMGCGVYFDPDDLNNPSPRPILSPYNIENKNFKGYVTEGMIAKRGRTRVMEFKLPFNEIIQGKLIKLKPCHNLSKLEGYPMLNNGSLVGINILTGTKPKSGNIKFKVSYGYKEYGSLDADYNIIEELKIDSINNFISHEFETLKYHIHESLILGIQADVSSDFVKGLDTEYSDIYCELIVEY